MPTFRTRIIVSFFLLLAILLPSTRVVRARQLSDSIFLPVITSNGDSTSTIDPTPTPDNTTGDGELRIAAAGRFTTTKEYEASPLENSEPVTDTVDINEPPLKSITCRTQQWGASQVRDLTDRVALGTDIGIIFPGALIQGVDFEDGLFTPITIPRAGGTIVMSGVTLEDGASYSRTLNRISPSTVKDAVSDILSNYVEGGTEAKYGDEFFQTYSYEHMLFTLGLDARYGLASMEADLSIESTKQTNYTFYKFQQTFYDIIFEAPERSTSVFRDGANFTDTQPSQIAPGNPPLYVHKVSYGRIVYFVAESQYSALDVEATLKAAVAGEEFGGSLDSGLTYQQVMNQTRINTFALGGNAGDALANVREGSASARFNAITKFVSNYGNGNFSSTNPGSPIAYELRYLDNRQVARMNYTTVFDHKDCTSTVEQEAPAPQPKQMWVRIKEVNDDAAIYLYGKEKVKIKSAPSGFYSVNAWLAEQNKALDQDHIFTMKLFNGNGGDANVRLEIFVGQQTTPTFVKSSECTKVWPLACPDREWNYRVNLVKGTWKNEW
ncbi:thiol-activated cytolysin family protein [Chloroflexi bacterium TSY]|nr:thiol-activated cytolysin family protein [Chloroflexi bacterium TSY]